MNLIKVTLDNGQSGGPQLSIRSQGKLIWQERIHLLPKKDDIEIMSVHVPNSTIKNIEE